jgi:hypothetical protein
MHTCSAQRQNDFVDEQLKNSEEYLHKTASVLLAADEYSWPMHVGTA